MRFRNKRPFEKNTLCDYDMLCASSMLFLCLLYCNIYCRTYFGIPMMFYITQNRQETIKIQNSSITEIVANKLLMNVLFILVVL